MLKYAHENGCPWDEKTCYWAIINENLNILEYIIAKGCKICKDSCSIAA